MTDVDVTFPDGRVITVREAGEIDLERGIVYAQNCLRCGKRVERHRSSRWIHSDSGISWCRGQVYFAEPRCVLGVPPGARFSVAVPTPVYDDVCALFDFDFDPVRIR